MAEFDAAKEAQLLCAFHNTPFGRVCSCRKNREALERAYAAGIEAAAKRVESATISLTKVHGFTLDGPLAPIIPIGAACAAEIRALLPAKVKDGKT